MRTILVEARWCVLCQEILDEIARTCRSLGHRVVRWRGPISGPRVPHSRQIVPCDAAFIWNGTHPRLEDSLATLQEMGTQVAFVELGWNPQRGTCQIDRQGINANASWSAESLSIIGHTKLGVREQGDLLAALQLDDDTQVTKLSPWFKNMRQFVEFLCLNSALPVRVRPHPKARFDADLPKRVSELGGIWDDSPSFAVAMQRCRAVAILNSSVGLEALGQGLPVLCYGLANYRHPGAVYCLEDSPQATHLVTAQLALGNSELTEERAQAAYERVMSHQWRCEDICQRLPPLLQDMLEDVTERSPSPIPSLRSWFRISNWLRTRQSA